jgi:integrase
MPLSDSQIRALVPGEKRYRVADGEGLCVVVEPISKGGGKSFVGRWRFPPGRQGKQGDYRIGVYGRGFGQISLKAARDEWERVRTWSRENNRPPTDLKKDHKQEQERQRTSPTFKEACDAWDRDYSAISEKNKPEYRRIIQNQLLPEFGATTPVAHLSWDYKHPDGRTTREWVVNYLDRTRERAESSATKHEAMLRQIFQNAARNDWIQDNQNPVGTRVATPKQLKRQREKVVSYADLKWDEFPEFFEVFNANACGGESITRGALLLLLMTGLRVDAVTGMEWSEVDAEKGVWTVHPSRMKTWQQDKTGHLVHLTDPMQDLLERMAKISGGERFVFPGRKQSGVPKHLNNTSPNRHLQRLGYQGRFQAHGIRSTVWTLTQEVCGTTDFVGRLQGGWKTRDKMGGIYDRYAHLDERKKHLIAWSDALLDVGMDIALI